MTELKHGQLFTYTRRGCRCDECKAAKAAHARDYFERNRRAVLAAQRRRYRARKEEAARAARWEEVRGTSAEPHWWDEKLDVAPLADLLRREVQGIGVTNVAAACGVHARRISVICAGYYWKGGKKYRVRFVTMRVVDAWCVALGYHARDLYPDRF